MSGCVNPWETGLERGRGTAPGPVKKTPIKLPQFSIELGHNR